MSRRKTSEILEDYLHGEIQRPAVSPLSQTIDTTVCVVQNKRIKKAGI